MLSGKLTSHEASRALTEVFEWSVQLELTACVVVAHNGTIITNKSNQRVRGLGSKVVHFRFPLWQEGRVTRLTRDDPSPRPRVQAGTLRALFVDYSPLMSTL